MNLKNAAITAVHGYLPEYIMTNKELESIVETNDEWIKSRTGIHQRHIQKEIGKATSDMCVEVVNGILEKSGTKASEIDMIICGTITGDYVFPDTANTIADKCGLVNAFGYDINAACSGFLFGLTTGCQFISTGFCKKVIVLGADKMSSILDYQDRTTCVIFGDGAGGVLLEPTTEDVGFVDAILKGDGDGRHILHMKAGGSLKPTTKETVAAREHYVYQEGKSVFKKAVTGMIDTTTKLLERNDINKADIDWLVPHQANLRIIQAVASGFDFSMDKVMLTIAETGNTTAGTLPLCLWKYEDKLKKGDNVIITAFGGGLTWGSIYLKWAY